MQPRFGGAFFRRIDTRAHEVLDWWHDAQNDVDDDRNIFDRAPDFAGGSESGRPDVEIAADIAKWWPDVQSMTSGERGEWNDIDRTPFFVVMAEFVAKRAADAAPVAEAVAEPRRPRPR